MGATVEGMKKLIRYNDYENDPLSLGNACNGIAARCDLNKGKEFQLDDAIDAKVISGSMFYIKKMACKFFRAKREINLIARGMILTRLRSHAPLAALLPTRVEQSGQR